jgi:2-polyprenyl-3-methyl-5-hydroxy-6-metoxy-1,4-benzoquinol methylase
MSSGTATGAAAAYAEKGDRYFGNVRDDFLRRLPANPAARVLEVGCGSGATGSSALARGLCSWYAGVELVPAAAARAAGVLSEVVCGDVENSELPWDRESFDALLLGEVLEHLVDPWTTLKRLRALVRPGGVVLASSPNVSHYSMIIMLLKGRWDLCDVGVMDRTHLRWFTPRTFAQMFEGAGFAVDELAPVARPGPKSRVARLVLPAAARHLLWRQILLRGHAVSERSAA